MSSGICLLAPSSQLRAHFRGVGIFDLLEDTECLFGEMDGFRMLAKLVQGQTHIPEMGVDLPFRAQRSLPPAREADAAVLLQSPRFLYHR